MKMAIRLLSENKLSVSEVAEAVGYTDTFTFSKAFKRHFHQSPSSCKGIDYGIATGMLGLARANILTPKN